MSREGERVKRYQTEEEDADTWNIIFGEAQRTGEWVNELDATIAASLLGQHSVAPHERELTKQDLSVLKRIPG